MKSTSKDLRKAARKVALYLPWLTGEARDAAVGRRAGRLARKRRDRRYGG